MDEKHFKILQFLSGQENPVKFDKFPDTIKSLFRQNTIQEGSLIHELKIALSNKLWVKESKDLRHHFYITDLGNSELLNEINRQKISMMTETDKMNLLLNQLNTKDPGVCHQLDELSTATGLDIITIEVLCRKIDAKGDCSYHQHCTSINPQGVYTANNDGYKDESSSGSTHYHGSVLKIGGDVNAPILQDSSFVNTEIVHKVKTTPNIKEAIARQSGLRKFINNPFVKWVIGIITALFIAYLIYYLKLNGDKP